MIKIRPSFERGAFENDWLSSKFSFSFSEYHDPKFMGFNSLRVINDDHIAAGAGFPLHPHRNMEIMTYVISGAVQHKDSFGNSGVIKAGEVQLMSAGKGVRHSEVNASNDEELHLLQIWIHPESNDLEPSYSETKINPATKRGMLAIIATPDGRDNSLKINQDIVISSANLDGAEKIDYKLNAGRSLWVQIAQGSVELNGIKLNLGDGAAVTAEENLVFDKGLAADFILFDMATV